MVMSMKELSLDTMATLMQVSRPVFDVCRVVLTRAAMHGRTLSAEALQFAQSHLRIISGLYGIVRPLDYIQPYRLCMGTKLAVDDENGTRHPSLYSYWQPRLGTFLVVQRLGHQSTWRRGEVTER